MSSNPPVTIDLNASKPNKLFTNVNVTIQHQGEHVGDIQAVILHRRLAAKQKNGGLYGVLGRHSYDLGWIGCSLMEPLCGRTKLRSLREYDNPNRDWMVIEKFRVTAEHRQHNSDVAATALQQFLHHPFISGQVSSVAYELDAAEFMSEEEKDRVLFGPCGKELRIKPGLEVEKTQWDAWREELAWQDAIPFLRNGFFQDAALADPGKRTHFLLVASHEGHLQQPLKSDDQVAGILFLPSREDRPLPPSGKDKELLNFVEEAFRRWKPTSILSILEHLKSLVHDGASVARSGALQHLCHTNRLVGVQLLLAVEPSAIDTIDSHHCKTPLMIAADMSARRCTDNGISETDVVNLLLSRGASKTVQDKRGMTAYGHFIKARKQEYTIMHSCIGHIHWVQPPFTTSSEQELQEKLAPPGGPTRSDLNGGLPEGFVDYDQEDGARTTSRKRRRT